MSTNTSCSPSTPQISHVVTANASEHKITRIATMTKRLLDEVDSQPLDTASLERLRTNEAPIRRHRTQQGQSSNPVSTPLITAIIRRITQQRLTAAQTAAILHLTGPKATKLFHADIDEFTLDELVNMLPSLQLSLQVIPAPPAPGALRPHRTS